MNENLNALDEINKGACMGMDALSCIIEKIQDEKFKEFAVLQYERYQSISKEISKVYKKYSKDKEPHETSMMTKMMTYYGIEMRTMKEKSDSKNAELLLQGTNMGIIEGRKLLNNKNINKEVNKIINKFVAMQEEMVERLKEFL